MAIETVTINLLGSTHGAEDGAWVPTTFVSTGILGELLYWGWDGSDYYYRMASATFPVAAPPGGSILIHSGEITIDATSSLSFSATGDDIAFSRSPDILVDFAADLPGGFSNYAAVTAGDVARFTPTIYTAEGADPTGIYSGTASIGAMLLSDADSFGIRIGFDATLTPTTFPTPSGGTQVEQAMFRSGDTITLTFQYEIICTEPDAYVNPTPPCEEPYTLDAMAVFQLALDGNGDLAVGDGSFSMTVNEDTNTQRALLWFETCVLDTLFSSISKAYLKITLDSITREPCHPYLSGYYTQAYNASNELEPVLSSGEAWYLYDEYGTSVAPTQMWALGKGLMTEVTTDTEWSGDATAIFELVDLGPLDGAVTGIVLRGDSTYGNGILTLADNPQLLICGVPKDVDQDGSPDPTDPDPRDPDNPTTQPPPTTDPDNDNDGDGDADRDNDERDKDRRRGEREIFERREHPNPFEQPAPTKIEAMRRFLLRLRRDGN